MLTKFSYEYFYRRPEFIILKFAGVFRGNRSIVSFISALIPLSCLGLGRRVFILIGTHHLDIAFWCWLRIFTFFGGGNRMWSKIQLLYLKFGKLHQRKKNRYSYKISNQFFTWCSCLPLLPGRYASYQSHPLQRSLAEQLPRGGSQADEWAFQQWHSTSAMHCHGHQYLQGNSGEDIVLQNWTRPWER